MSFNINHIFYSPAMEGSTDPITPADPEEPVTSETENNEKNKSSKNLITSLKDFLSKLTGTTIKGKNLVEVIDNGTKNITENQGQSSGSSDGSVLYTNFIVTNTDSEKGHIDKTFAEVVDAVEAGKWVFLKYVSEGNVYISPLNRINSGNLLLDFSGMELSADTINDYPTNDIGQPK